MPSVMGRPRARVPPRSFGVGPSLCRRRMPSIPEHDIEGEVTRVDAVTYLLGATGHGVGSLAFLLFGGVGYWLTGVGTLGLGGLLGAFMLSANGLSIYVWAVTRDAVYTKRDAGEDPEPTRAISRPSLSTEHVADHVAGFVQVSMLVMALLVVIGLFDRFGAEMGALLLGTGLALGNVGALVANRVWGGRKGGPDRPEPASPGP